MSLKENWEFKKTTKVFWQKYLCLLFIVLLFSCSNKKNIVNSNFFLSDELYSIQNSNINNTKKDKLPVSLLKLKQLLGQDIIPVDYYLFDLNNDLKKELIFCFKENLKSNIIVYFLEILPNENIKTIYQVTTDINVEKDFSITANNLFAKDDLNIIVEGVSSDDKRHLYIINVMPKFELKLIASFSASYSILINYDEIEEEDHSKYFKLKEIVIIDIGISSTNVNTQKKDVYQWNNNSKSFVLSESSYINTNQISNIPLNILNSVEEYFNYIKGFWYPEKYVDIIKANNFDDSTINKLEYLYIGEDDNDKIVNFSKGYYIDQYYIDKIVKYGAPKPGLRFSLKNTLENDRLNYKSIDLYLNSASTIYIKEPDDTDYQVFIRLEKPFVEYVYDYNNSNNLKKINELKKEIDNSTFKMDNTIIKFSNNQFEIKNENVIETGSYKIDVKDDVLLYLFFDSSNTILQYKYFIVTYNKSNKTLSLLPITFSTNKYLIKKSKPYLFQKN